VTKAKISEYSATANDNTDVNGVNIAEGCPPSSMNNMGREIMAALKRFQVGSDGDGVTVGGNFVVSGTTALSTALPVASGGTGAATLTANNVVIGNGTSAVNFVAPGTSGNVLTSNGTTWTSAAGAASDKIEEGDSKVEVTDTGTGKVEITVDNVEVADFTTGAIVFNETGANQDFRVEGDSNANLIFADAGVDKVGIGTNTFNTNGGVLQVSNGISFPATQSACSDANTLDDYEEGTWTPAYGSGANSWAYTVQVGRYIRIGNCVTHTFYIAAIATIVSTNAQVGIGGLPFTGTGVNSEGRVSGSCKFGPNFGTQQISPIGGPVTWSQTDSANDGNGFANTTNWPAATSVVHFGTFVLIL
jgi:hypothetical protein